MARRFALVSVSNSTVEMLAPDFQVLARIQGGRERLYIRGILIFRCDAQFFGHAKFYVYTTCFMSLSTSLF